MSTYEATISMIKELPEPDLLIVKEFVRRLSHKSEERKEIFNPYKALTREEIIEQLAIAKMHANSGMVNEAHSVSSDIREKYGL